jgi:hypothetical protein
MRNILKIILFATALITSICSALMEWLDTERFSACEE